jgi:hypothetical protein
MLPNPIPYLSIEFGILSSDLPKVVENPGWAEASIPFVLVLAGYAPESEELPMIGGIQSIQRSVEDLFIARPISQSRHASGDRI